MKDKWVLPVCGALTIFAVLCYLAPGAADCGKSEAKEVSVKVKSLSFDPKKLEVHVGDTVVWTNLARTKHTATSDDEGKTFDTDEIAPGQSSKSVKFEREGEFRYYCKVHGHTMSGTIVVKARPK